MHIIICFLQREMEMCFFFPWEEEDNRRGAAYDVEQQDAVNFTLMNWASRWTGYFFVFEKLK